MSCYFVPVVERDSLSVTGTLASPPVLFFIYRAHQLNALPVGINGPTLVRSLVALDVLDSAGFSLHLLLPCLFFVIEYALRRLPRLVSVGAGALDRGAPGSFGR